MEMNATTPPIRSSRHNPSMTFRNVFIGVLLSAPGLWK
jgi:hypothetical protein